MSGRWYVVINVAVMYSKSYLKVASYHTVTLFKDEEMREIKPLNFLNLVENSIDSY